MYTVDRAGGGSDLTLKLLNANNFLPYSLRQNTIQDKADNASR